MKLNGKLISGVNFEMIFIPRPAGEVHVFKASAVLDYTAFHELCKPPVPPEGMRPGGEKVPLLDDPTYVAARAEYLKRETDYTILMSLSGTPGLEWDTVNLNDPATWKNFRTELKAAGFSPVEIGRIIDGVWTANGLDDEKIDAARRSFVQAQQAPQSK